MKKITYALLLFLILLSTNVYADTRTGYIKNTKITVNGTATTKLNDNNFYSLLNIKKGDTIEIESPKQIKSIYIIYSVYSKSGTISYDGNLIMIGGKDILHEYIELDTTTDSFDITYDDNLTLKEIYVFEGDTPDWVQKWLPPYDDADMLVLPTHSDDEHLFFAGLIPKMIDDGKKIQVVYFTIHNGRPIRMDEQLDGLWAAGVRNYPVVGIVPDAYSLDTKTAIKRAKESNLTEEDIIKFNVDIVRRFKPEVIVCHDEKGEYGHGQHRLSTKIMEESLKYFNDPIYESTYEPFEPNKIYIHLYKKNPIVMNYDIPLDSFDGKTAFRVSMYAFSKHVTQQYQVYGKWQNLDKATEIKQYSPIYYGLYYSNVGYDNVDNDMFYNIPEKKEPIIIEPTTTTTAKVEEPTKVEEDKLDMIFKIILISLTVILVVLDILIIIIKKSMK